MAEYIKASVQLAKECKQKRITARQKAFADLLAAGWKDKDAYQVVGLFQPLTLESENWSDMRKLMAKPDFQNYKPEITTTDAPRPKRKKAEEEEISDLLSKDRQMRDLAAKLNEPDLDIKTELDIRKMIAEYLNFKKEQNVEEEKKRMYYLPMKCFNCSLYLNTHR